MTSEQAALLEKARQSLQAAKLLASQSFYNFAASRAYYTMFYIAEALLLGDGLAFSKHSSVIAAFGQRFARTGRVPKELHRYLIEAENSRKVGDYDIKTSISQSEADEIILRAEQFLDVAQNLIGAIP